MSWMQRLVEVYDNNIEHVGHFEEKNGKRITLLPVSHVTQGAHIEVLVTKDGNFHSAKVIAKEDSSTILPTTLDSANRSGAKVAPYYIHDKLSYVAGDYLKFGGEEKRKEHFSTYINQFKEWVDSDYTSSKLKSIFDYVSKGNLIHDLVDARVLFVGEDGEVLNKWTSTEEKPEIYKAVTGEVLAAFVRFDVKHETPDEPVVWEDRKLFDDFIAFLKAKDTIEVGYCYVEGDTVPLTTKHGSRIRHAGDQSKLISSNDSSGFTYRGRFKHPEDAVQIGYMTSQKSHHALRFLIQRQGTYVDSRYFVIFGIEKSQPLNPLFGTSDLISDALFEENKRLEKSRVLTEEKVTNEITKAINGFRDSLKDEDLENIIIIALDAATTGRLAITYYQELTAKVFYDAILNWHSTCIWLQTYKRPNTKEFIRFEGVPSTRRMADAIYGMKADAKVKKEFYTRILPCIVEGKGIPRDIVETIFNRVKNPFSFEHMSIWGNVLNIACALINKQYESEGYTVALQKDNDSRDYLFGRLLGIAEVMEKSLLRDKGENRATNATRYFNAFAQHPARTWLVLRKQLTPYFEKTGFNTGYYEMLIQQVEDMLPSEAMTDNALNPPFLLGYSSQVQDFYKKKEDDE